MDWEFKLPVKLVFGTGKRNYLKEYIEEARPYLIRNEEEES